MITNQSTYSLALLGSQATEFIFNNQVNTRFDNSRFTIKNYGKFTFEGVPIINSEIIVFDLLYDVVRGIADKENYWEKLDNFLQSLSGTIIYNSVRYASHVTENNVTSTLKDVNSIISNQTRVKRNTKLDEIELYIQKKYNQVNIIKYDDEHSAVELNKKINGFNDLYYNTDYYLNSWIQIQEILSSQLVNYFATTIRAEDWDDLSILAGSNKDFLIFDSDKDESLLRSSIKDPMHSILRKVYQNDYILDGGVGKTKFFVKRSLFYRSNLEKLHNIWFTREINEKRLSGNGIQRILFYFEPMNADDWSSDDAERQALPGRFQSLSRSLVKDTVLIRVGDLNLSRGSYWYPTSNYPEYEKDVREFIESLISEYSVPRENVVLYGFSRGGFGSLYYGKLLDLKVVAVDPVVDAEFFVNERNDMHFLTGIRPVNLVDAVNSISDDEQTHSKIVLSNENTGNQVYENSVLPLNIGKTLKIINIKDKKANWHGKIAEQTVPETLTLINELLDERFSIHH